MFKKFALGTLLAFMTVVTAQAAPPQGLVINTQVDYHDINRYVHRDGPVMSEPGILRPNGPPRCL